MANESVVDVNFIMMAIYSGLGTFFWWSITYRIKKTDESFQSNRNKLVEFIDKYYIDINSINGRLTKLESDYKMTDKELVRYEERLQAIELSIKDNHAEISKSVASLSENMAVLNFSLNTFIETYKGGQNNKAN
jgi:chromosome segregation ATPase